MSDALRELLASFVVEVDKAGELAKGNAAVDALKARLEELQAAFAKTKAPAEKAAKAASDVFTRAAQQANTNLRAIAAAQLGGRADTGGFGSLGALVGGKAQFGPDRQQLGPTRDTFNQARQADYMSGLGAAQLGPTRDTLNQARQATYLAEQAAAKYAGTLRGKLASAVDAVRAGFNRAGGGGGGSGPGLVASLATARNGLLALAGGATAGAIKRVVDGIGGIGEGAAKLGVTNAQFQRLKVLAAQNDSSVQALGGAFRNLANAAAQPTKATTAAFTKLGVSVKDNNGQFKSSNDLFFDVARGLAGVGNETERSAIAQDLLGRGAQDLKAIFSNGADAVDRQRAALQKLGVISDETIASADAASDMWAAFPLAILAAADPILKVLLPALVQLTTWLGDGVEWLGKWLKGIDLTSVGLTALAAVLSLKVVPAVRIFIAQARLMMALGGGASKSLLSMAAAGAKAALSFARLAFGILILEDFFTFLNGGDSATGRLIEAIFGKAGVDVTLKAVKDLKLALKDLWNWVTGAGQGEGIARLWQEFGNGITVLINDLLAKIGIGKGGTNGPFKLSETITSNSQGGTGGVGGSGSVPSPFPVYGENTLPKGKSITVGDTHVTVNMGPSATAPDVGRAVVSATEANTNALIAGYGGFE